MYYSPSQKENIVETSASRFRQALGEQLVESLRTPPPSHTPRRVRGRFRFPGKATAVIGMRRAGKTTFLHQIRAEVVARGGSLTQVPYLSFEDERLIDLAASDLGLVLDEYARLLPAEAAGTPVLWCFVSGCVKARINGEQRSPLPAVCGAGDDSERWVGV